MISRRLDQIEQARRAAAINLYTSLPAIERNRLADALATVPTRLIAETALTMLRQQDCDAILARFEQSTMQT
jgi:hypothetical protein